MLHLIAWSLIDWQVTGCSFQRSYKKIEKKVCIPVKDEDVGIEASKKEDETKQNKKSNPIGKGQRFNIKTILL